MQHSEEQTWLSQMIFLMNAEKCISSSALVWINKWSGVGGFWSAFAVHWYNIVVFVLYFWTLDLGWLIGELIVSLVCKSGKDFSEREPCINHCSPPLRATKEVIEVKVVSNFQSHLLLLNPKYYIPSSLLTKTEPLNILLLSLRCAHSIISLKYPRDVAAWQMALLFRLSAAARKSAVMMECQSGTKKGPQICRLVPEGQR